MTVQTIRELLDLAKKHSTCRRLQVGAFLASKDLFVLGWNGAILGRTSDELCIDHFDGSDMTEHHEWQRAHEVHAEIMVLERARAVGLKSGVLYTTSSPCLNCALQIIEFRGIKEVRYLEPYDYPGASGVSLLQKNGIKVERIE